MTRRTVVALHGFVRRMWAGTGGFSGALVGSLLLPVSGCWRVVAAGRNAWYDARPPHAEPDVRVISVGNIVAGGTGKTPVAAWVVRTLVDEGVRPAVALRGYGADEGRLHGAWTTDVPVITHRDRRIAVALAKTEGAEVIVLDDGFQHRRLHRDLDIVLVAVEDRLRGRAIPRGPCREPASSLRRADVVILTRRSATRAQAEDRAEAVARVTGRLGEQVVDACVHLAAGRLTRLTPDWAPFSPVAPIARGGTRTAGPAPSTDEPGPVLDAPFLLTAIARPDHFLRDVAERSGGRAEVMAFPDHHDFDHADVARARALADRRPIVVTEKDAVKLVRFADRLGETWVLDQRLAWDWGEAEVRGRVYSAARVGGVGP